MLHRSSRYRSHLRPLPRSRVASHVVTDRDRDRHCRRRRARRRLRPPHPPAVDVSPAPGRGGWRRSSPTPRRRCSSPVSTARIVGALTLAFYRIPTGRKAWIEDVVVDDAVRGRGVGEALSRAAVDEARRRAPRTSASPAAPTARLPTASTSASASSTASPTPTASSSDDPASGSRRFPQARAPIGAETSGRRVSKGGWLLKWTEAGSVRAVSPGRRSVSAPYRFLHAGLTIRSGSTRRSATAASRALHRVTPPPAGSPPRRPSDRISTSKIERACSFRVPESAIRPISDSGTRNRAGTLENACGNLQPSGVGLMSSAAWRTCQSRSVAAAAIAAATSSARGCSGVEERRQGEHGAPPDRRLVAGGGEDRREPVVVADRAERGDGGLAHQCVAAPAASATSASSTPRRRPRAPRSPHAHAATSTTVGRRREQSAAGPRAGTSGGRHRTARRRTTRSASANARPASRSSAPSRVRARRAPSPARRGRRRRAPAGRRRRRRVPGRRRPARGDGVPIGVTVT